MVVLQSTLSRSQLLRLRLAVRVVLQSTTRQLRVVLQSTTRQLITCQESWT